MVYMKKVKLFGILLLIGVVLDGGEDFGIKRVISSVDYNQNGMDDIKLLTNCDAA